MSRTDSLRSSTGPSTPRVATSARIVAVVVMALLAASLAYLRLAGREEAVSVPAGASAGDLILQPCDYPTERGTFRADCGTLVVPENRTNPRSRLIALPVVRIRALSEHPAQPIFYLEGGPGITNMKFPQASRYVEDRDVVLVGYRGVDGSVRLDCPEVDTALKHSTDPLTAESFRAYGDAFRTCADRLTAEGVDLAGYGLPQEVDDVEAARAALGYDRIELLSQSAGTRTAMIYAWRFPQSIHRSVMIGVNPPGNFLWKAQASEEQIGRYAAQCATDSSCRTRTRDLAATIQRTTADMPDRWGFLPINRSNVLIFTFYGLMETTSHEAPLNAAATVDSWLSAGEGDPSGLWAQSLFGDVFPIPFVWGQYAAAASLDAPAAREYFASGEQQREPIAYAGSAFAWGGGRMTDGWPASPTGEEYRQVRTSDVATLLIGGALDTSTPPQNATRELLPYLPNGHQVVLPGFGHTATFFAEQPESGSRLINTFFASGRVDDSLYRPQKVDFTPASTLTGLAKAIAGVMVGLALLMVLSLLWTARHAHSRGHFGPKASAGLRSLHPIVLGPGGWFLGALVVLTTMPSVPLDDPRLVVLAIGAPVGLGIYWAWVDQDWTTRTKAVGFAAAAGGALVGSWLGFEATEGFLALATATVGAAVGANLMVLVVDIMRERAESSPLAPTETPPAPAHAIDETPLPHPRPSSPGLRPDADEAVQAAAKSSGQLPSEGARAHDRSGRGHSGQA